MAVREWGSILCSGGSSNCQGVNLMAQTTGALVLSSCKIMVATAATFPTGALDISGISNTLGLDGGDVNIIRAFTFGTSTPIIAPGNKDELTLNISAFYTEN